MAKLMIILLIFTSSILAHDGFKDHAHFHKHQNELVNRNMDATINNCQSIKINPCRTKTKINKKTGQTSTVILGCSSSTRPDKTAATPDDIDHIMLDVEAEKSTRQSPVKSCKTSRIKSSKTKAAVPVGTSNQPSTSPSGPLSTPNASISPSLASTTQITSSFIQISSIPPSSQPSIISQPGSAPDHQESIIIPSVTWSTVYGPAISTANKNFLNLPMPTMPTIPSNVFVTNPGPSIQNDYPFDPSTGLNIVDPSNIKYVENIKAPYVYYRDGGHGSKIGDTVFFVFSDTNSYYAPNILGGAGPWTGMVSASIGIDVGMGPLSGKPLTLGSPIGSFVGDSGNPRVPFQMTIAETQYPWKVDGSRYFLWQAGSGIPLTKDVSIFYTKLMLQIKDGPAYFSGMTLSEATVPVSQQPIFNRTVPLLFDGKRRSWGEIGGIRSWGCSGVGGNDGMVYLFTTTPTNDGLVVGRVAASFVHDASRYTFWNGKSWTSDDSQAQPFLHTQFSTGDIFYSPRHGTFIAVFSNNYLDNKIYYSYLQAPSFISPSHDCSNWVDIVENIVKYSWTPAVQVLHSVPPNAISPSYSAGILQGYFGNDDLTNGGRSLLVTWNTPTSDPTGGDPDGLKFEHAQLQFN